MQIGVLFVKRYLHPWLQVLIQARDSGFFCEYWQLLFVVEVLVMLVLARLPAMKPVDRGGDRCHIAFPASHAAVLALVRPERNGRQRRRLPAVMVQTACTYQEFQANA